MEILFIWLGMIGLALVQLPLMIRKKQWRELIAYGGIWLLAGVYASLVVSDIRMLNAFEIIEMIFTGVYGMLT